MVQVDVHVQGRGAVALAAALALARQGLHVALGAQPARSEVSREDVRAYALNARSVALLQSLKVWPALPPDAKTPVHDMRIEGDARGAALHFSAWQQGVEQLAWIVDAAALEAALREAVGFAPHVHMTPAEEVAPSLRLFAEGRDSPSRAALGVNMPLHLHGQVAVAARLHTGQPHAGLARQWFRCPDVLALLPFDRPHAGCSYGLVWSLPEARARELMAAPEAAFNLALMDATSGAAGTLALASARAQWPLASGRAEAVCGPGWALLGDGAHVVHPLAGQGLNLGLADVAVLAEVIASREPWRGLGDERLLRRYARQRALPTAAMLHLTDGLLELFASPAPWLRELRNRGLSLVNGLGPLKRALTARALDA
jgi:2-polyprenyl-6-methoxyphenol hydroxylase-like FAD-dependent oxidoreductase